MKRYILILLLLYGGTYTYSQQLLDGVITSIDEKPLEGASIEVLNTNIKTFSDIKGNFQIRIFQDNLTLKISHIGYQTAHVKLSSPFDSPVIVSLQQQADTLEEVQINTGYQLIPRERATGSFSTLGSRRLNEQVGMNILDRLPAIANSYLVTSPRINSNAYVTIRGFSTMGGPRGPLIILDNFPYEGDINNINPNDVESIVLLKDAAAASIWGTRAGNGVIVITTKKSAFNSNTKIEFNSNFTVTDKPDLYSYKVISSSDYIDLERLLFFNKYRFSDTANISRPLFSPVYEILFKQNQGKLSQQEADEQINNLKNRDVRSDFDKYIYRKGRNQQYAINMIGGASNISWLVSAGYDKNIGQVGQLDERITLKMENTYRVNDRLLITMGAYYTQRKGESGKRGYGALSIGNGTVPPYTQLADENGNALPLYAYRQTFLDTAGNGKLLDWKYYPLEDDKHKRDLFKTDDILANTGLRYTILNGLTADARFQYERQNIGSQLLQGLQSYSARNLINSFSQIDGRTGSVIYKVPKGDILDMNTSVLQSYNIRGQINFEQTYLHHGISSLLGGEIRQNNGDINSFRTYGLDQDILTIASVDFANQYPQYLTGWPAFIPNPANFEKTVNRYVSLFGNLAYTYKKRYVLTASARKDASNIFGVAVNDKWKPLWSVGASWDISSESFYRSTFLPFLKIRSTYGFSGNIDPSRVASTTIRYNSSKSPYTGTPMTEVENFYNPQLRWEKVGMFNIGADFRTIENRISGSIEYFIKKAEDLYGSVPIDMTVGLMRPSLIKNTATMKGRGLDIELNTINVKGGFEWMSNLNFSSYNDKVIESYVSSFRGSSFVGGGMKGLEGKPLYSLFSYRWKGLDPENGNPLGYINSHISDDYRAITGDSTLLSDLVYNGTLIPKVYGSLGNTIRWKSASLTFRLSYALGHYFLRESINYSQLVNTGIGHSDYALRWQSSGDVDFTNVPSWIYPIDSRRDSFYNNSEVLVTKGDNIRLQYINFSFALPPNKIKHIGLASGNIFCVINNLGILWRANKDQIDPDYPNTFNSPPKSISLGLNVKF